MINQMQNYKAGNEIIYNTEVLKSNICDCNEPEILLKGDVTVTAAPSTQVLLKIVHHLLNVSQKLMEQQ